MNDGSGAITKGFVFVYFIFEGTSVIGIHSIDVVSDSPLSAHGRLSNGFEP